MGVAMLETTINSFVLRFVQEQTPSKDSETAWHGVIRHVQSNEKIRFTRIEDALGFVTGYVEIEGRGTGRRGDAEIVNESFSECCWEAFYR